MQRSICYDDGQLISIDNIGAALEVTLSASDLTAPKLFIIFKVTASVV